MTQVRCPIPLHFIYIFYSLLNNLYLLSQLFFKLSSGFSILVVCKRPYMLFFRFYTLYTLFSLYPLVKSSRSQIVLRFFLLFSFTFSPFLVSVLSSFKGVRFFPFSEIQFCRMVNGFVVYLVFCFISSVWMERCRSTFKSRSFYSS